MSIESMKLALDALQNIHPGNMTPMAEEAWDKAIHFLRQAIEQAEQAEPVAWMVYTLDGKSVFVTDSPADFTEQHRALPLYTAPPPRQPLTEQEIEDLYFSEQDKWWRLELNEFENVARAIERKIF